MKIVCVKLAVIFRKTAKTKPSLAPLAVLCGSLKNLFYV